MSLRLYQRLNNRHGCWRCIDYFLWLGGWGIRGIARLLQAQSRGRSAYKNNFTSCCQIDVNLQSTRKKHSVTYIADFLIASFFFLSTLGSGTVPKALADTSLPVEGGVCPGEATATVTIELWPAEGDCSRVASAVPLDVSTAMVGSLYPFVVSSPTSSSIVTLACLGFGELINRNQEEG
jgi:hypothetical protein